MAPRPPSDAAVALRSLPRRYRDLFAGLGDDESPDALALRTDAGGATALGLLIGATRGLTTTAQGLSDLLLHSSASVADPLGLPDSSSGTVEERLAELGWEADALADQIERVAATEWSARGVLGAQGEPITALELVWRGIDRAIDNLRQAERTLAEVRRQR